MEIIGPIIVRPLMCEMKVGEKAFLDLDAVSLINDKIFINTSYAISKNKNAAKNKLIPVERTGPELTDFKVDVNVTATWINQEFTETEVTSFCSDKYVIGPFDVVIEKLESDKYRTQIYPRMDYDELTNTLIVINQSMGDSFKDSAEDDEDRNELRRLIKEKLEHFSLIELEDELFHFLPIPEGQDDNGEIVNYMDDEDVAMFIREKIKDLKAKRTLEDMTVPELEEEFALANDKEDYIYAGKVDAVLKNRKNTQDN